MASVIIPDLLYENLLLALERKDMELLLGFWRQSLAMGSVGEEIRKIVTSASPRLWVPSELDDRLDTHNHSREEANSFRNAVEDHYWQHLRVLYAGNFDALLKEPWDKFLTNLFLRKFIDFVSRLVDRSAERPLRREKVFDNKNSGRFCLLLCQHSTDQRRLKLALPKILEYAYGEYEFFYCAYAYEYEGEDKADLKLFLDLCNEKSLRILIEAFLEQRGPCYVKKALTPELLLWRCLKRDTKGPKPDFASSYATFFKKVLFEKLQKPLRTNTMANFIFELTSRLPYPKQCAYRITEFCIALIEELDQKLDVETKYLLNIELRYLNHEGKKIIKSCHLSPEMRYALMRNKILQPELRLDNKEEYGRLFEEMQRELGLEFSVEEYRRVFGEDDLINIIEYCQKR